MRNEVLTTRQYRGLTIETTVVGYAYARNGNAHNPTPHKKWFVRDAAGKWITWSDSLKGAKASVDDYLAHSESQMIDDERQERIERFESGRC